MAFLCVDSKSWGWEWLPQSFSFNGEGKSLATSCGVRLCLASHLFKMCANMDAVFLVVVLLSRLPFCHSTSKHRGNCRPIRFEPPMLDFHEQ